MSSTEDKLIDPLMRSFMYGQFANLFKFAFWWVALSPLLYALCDGSTAIGVGRIVYNTALCLASPFGPLLIEHISPRSILLGAAGVRFLVWCILLPLNWVLFDTNITDSKSIVGVYVIVVIMLILDGFAVGLSSVLDIDFMGVDIFAGFLGREVTEVHRNQFNSRNELFFSICFVIFSPGMAFVGLALRDAFDQWKKNGGTSFSMSFEQVESGTLAAIFIITFLVATTFQFYYFLPLTPENAEKLDQELNKNAIANNNNHNENSSGNSSSNLQSINNVNNSARDSSSPDEHSKGLLEDEKKDGAQQQQPEEGEAPPQTTGQIICGVFGDLKESFKLVISHRVILWRLIFFGFELAFEDASIVVLAAQVGIRVPWMGNRNSVEGSIWTAVIVAVGKIGAAAASFLMMKHYHPPEEIMAHTRLFISIGLSTLTILLVPIAFDGYSSGDISADAARALVFIAFLLYFFLSTLPKLGLMSLLQTMVSQVENGHRAFAFIAILATTIDSVVIMILSLLFTTADQENDAAFSRSLWITTYVFLAHGLLETIFGPVLILRPAAADAEVAKLLEQQQKEEEEKQKLLEDDENNKKDDNNDNNKEDVTAIKQDLLEGKSVPENPMQYLQNTENNNNNNAIVIDRGNNISNNNEIAGSYSARAIGVPIPMDTNNSNANLGGLSARRGVSNLGGGGGVSPRFGISPRAYQRSVISGLNNNNNNNQDDQQQQGGSMMMRHNMLGRSVGGAIIAASNVAIPMRTPSRLDGGGNNNNNGPSPGDDNNNNASSYVRSARGQRSFLEAQSGNKLSGRGNSNLGGGYGSA